MTTLRIGFLLNVTESLVKTEWVQLALHVCSTAVLGITTMTTGASMIIAYGGNHQQHW